MAESTKVVYRVQSRRTQATAAGRPWRFEGDFDTPEEAKFEQDDIAKFWGGEKESRVLKVTTTVTEEEVTL